MPGPALISDLNHLSDLDQDTCVDTYPDENAFTLKAKMSQSYKQLMVIIRVQPGQIHFDNAARCPEHTSVLMSHQGPENATSCGVFCAVPNKCEFVRNPHPDTFIFKCICKTTICNELILWLQPGSLEGDPSICDINAYSL